MGGSGFAIWFLPFTIVIGLWVAWSDMKTMKIPNRAVLALFAVYLVVGPIALPFQVWLWGWVVGFGVLVLGFVLNAAGAMGGGDAKFAAAMAPIMAQIDLRVLAVLTCATVLGAFATHRIFGFIPALRRRFAWESWDQPGFPFRSDFPMGLALAGILNFYLLSTILPHF